MYFIRFPFANEFSQIYFPTNKLFLYFCLFLGLCFLSLISHHLIVILRVYQVVLGVKDPLANAGDARDMGSIPGSGTSV